MANKKNKEVDKELEDKEVEKSEEKSEREIRWEEFLVKYKKQNPVKFELKRAAGELSKIPDSFN